MGQIASIVSAYGIQANSAIAGWPRRLALRVSQLKRYVASPKENSAPPASAAKAASGGISVS